MIEIRFHGRGGQGTVVASKVLADAVAKEGSYVQAYPEFGVERRGAPVFAFIRIDDKPIYDKSRIYAPDHVVVVDPTLVEAIDVTEGLKDGGWIIINSDKKPAGIQVPVQVQGGHHQRHGDRRPEQAGDAGRAHRQHGHRRRRGQDPGTDEARIPRRGHPRRRSDQARRERPGRQRKPTPRPEGIPRGA